MSNYSGDRSHGCRDGARQCQARPIFWPTPIESAWPLLSNVAVLSAREKEQQAIEVGEVARQAVARADDARRKADAKEKDFTDRIDRLKAALSEM